MNPQSRSSSADESGSGPPLDRTLILSVDDEPNIVYTRQMLLESAGYAVVNASGGNSALHRFSVDPIDLVLLDYYMPDLNGDLVAAEMKQRKPLVPIIMISASLGVAERVSPFVDSFIAKGDGPEVLLATIQHLLSTARAAGKTAE